MMRGGRRRRAKVPCPQQARAPRFTSCPDNLPSPPVGRSEWGDPFFPSSFGGHLQDPLLQDYEVDRGFGLDKRGLRPIMGDKPYRPMEPSVEGEFAVAGRDHEWEVERCPQAVDYGRSHEGGTPLEPHRGAPLDTKMLTRNWPKKHWDKHSKPSGTQQPHLSGTTKLPLGRFEGVISFVGDDYGFIERNDLKKFSFSFKAFWGNHIYMLPGVKVQFTIYKDKGKECATDVVVAPGGTEEVDSEMFQGVVITALGDYQVNLKPEKKPHPHYTGCIQANIFGNEMELPFGMEDSRVTLLPGDLVQFCLVTDLVTKKKRAAGISLMLDTFQLTKEIRETGIIMSITDDSGSVMSENQRNIYFDIKENLDNTKLNVMDEVEFTVISANSRGKKKAVRLKKLSENTVMLKNKAEEKTAENKDANKWKASTSEVLPQRTVVFEDVSSEQYKGTVLKPIPKTSKNLQAGASTSLYPGLLATVLEGKEKQLPFGADDVLSEASMLLGDKVQFSISTNRETKAERAINVEILPDTFQQTKELRETGMVLDLRESSGFIRCKQDPQMFFHFSEVMEERGLSVSDKVEFTVLPNTFHGDGLQAVRIKKLPEISLIPAQNLDGLTSASKDKKNITIKLMRDSVNEEMKNLKVKIDSFNSDVPQDDSPSEVNYSTDNKGELNLQLSKCRSPLHLEETCMEILGEQVVTEKSSLRGNGYSSAEVGDKRNSGNDGCGHCKDHSSQAEKHQSPSGEEDQSHSNSRDREYRDKGSPSHSKDREYRYKGRHSHSQDRDHRHKSRHSRSNSRDQCHRHRSRHRCDHKRGGDCRHNSQHSHIHNRGRDSRHKSSQSRDREYRDKSSHSRSHSRDREYRHKRSCSQDQGYKHNQSKEMTVQSSRTMNCSRSHSRERSNAYSWNRSQCGDEPSSPVKKSRSPDKSGLPVIDSCLVAEHKNKGFLVTQELPKLGNSLDKELAWKKKELELLEEQIARRRAIIAMEQRIRAQSTQSEAEKCRVDRHRLPEEPKIIHHPEETAPMPMKSILKKHNKPFVDPDIQLEATTDQASGHSFIEEPCPNQVLCRQSSSQDACINPHLCHLSMTQRPISEPSACHTLPQITSKYKSNLSTQIDRFLKTLNKGVDAKLLCSLVREAREATACYEGQAPCLLPEPDRLCKEQGQCDSIYERKSEQPDSHCEGCEGFLLPHQRAVQGNSGFSSMVGSEHIPQRQKSWGEEDVKNQEQFLCGEKVQPEENLVTSDEIYRASLPPSVEEDDDTEKKQTFGKIQTVLKTIGLDLDMAEVSRLTDRTQERLYGKKRNVKEKEYLDKEPESKMGRVDQQHSQPDPLDSKCTHSISPIISSNQKVYLSYSDKLESISTQGHSTRTIHNLETLQTVQNSAKVNVFPSSTSQYPQHLSDSVVEHSGYEDTNPENGYQLQTGATLSSWDHMSPQTETQPYPVYSQHHDSSCLSSFGQPQPYVNPSVYGQLPPVYLDTNFLQVPLVPAIGSYPRLLSAVSGQSLDPFNSFSAPLFTCNYPQPPLSTLPIVCQPQDGSSSATLQSLSVNNKQASFFKESQTSKSRCLRVIQTVTLKKEKKQTSPALKEVTVHTLSSDSVPLSSQDPLTAGKKQVATISEDDVKAKQKKRLEQFNERMRLKKEQLKAQRKCGEPQISTADKACKEVKNVWICGHSLVIWAEKRAKSPECGMQLSMGCESVRLWWKGRQGLMWEQLLPLLLELKGNWPNPDVLLMHLGGNDLGRSDPKDFLDSVKKDLASMKNIFPHCLLVWSSILPRRSWRTSEDAEVMESIRITVNKNVKAEIQALGGMVVDHEQIRPGSDSGLYRPDGVHLTGKGIDTFNLNLQDFLVKWESEMNQDSKPY